MNTCEFCRPKQGSLFGLPFGLFRDDQVQQKPRFQRKTPAFTPSNTDPYITSEGVPLYKYRQKYPQGYSGRKKRSPQTWEKFREINCSSLQDLHFCFRNLWTLLDPITGRTINPQQIDPTFDPLETQFENPELRANRNPETIPGLYLDQAGNPVYRQHKRYPYTG